MADAPNEVTSLAMMVGTWDLRATTNGYFDYRPHVDAAHLVYSEAPRGRVRFVVRFRVRGKVLRFTGSTRADRKGRSGFSWRGSGAWLVASRTQWALVQSADGLITVARNAGSMMAEPGALVLVRSDLTLTDARERMASDFRLFGFSPAEYQSIRWRSETLEPSVAEVR